MKEFPPPEDILKPNDKAPWRWVRATRWQCVVCDPHEKGGKATTVEWIGRIGRCRECGQKMQMADSFDKNVPGDEEPRKNRRAP